MVRPGRTARCGAVVVALLGAGTLAACSGSSSTTTGADQTAAPGAGGATTATTSGSNYEIVTDATVTAGLATVRKDAAQIKATLPTSQSDASAQTKQMYDSWFTFEGTVRKNEKNLYLQMEDGLAAIKAGTEQNNPTKVDKGIKDLEEGATAYLAKHP